MSTKKLFTRRIAAIMVAAILLVSTLFTGAVYASAASLADGLTDVASTAKNSYTPASSGWYSISDIADGGVKLSYSRFSADVNYSYKTNIGATVGAFPGKYGFMLQFDGYENKNTDATKVGNGLIAITLVNDPDNSEIKSGRPFVLIDTNTGALKLAHGTQSGPGHHVVDQTILTNDILKYDSIKNKAFTVAFSPYNDDYIIVAVNVDGNSVAGFLPRVTLFAQTYAPSSTGSNFFVGVSGTDTGADTNSWKLNFYGYKALDASYAAPTPEGLPGGLTEGLTHVATVADNKFPFNPGWSSHTNIAGGGVKFSYGRYSADLNYAYNVNIGTAVGTFPGTYGFMLQFDGYQNNNTATDNVGNGIFTIALISDITCADIKTGVPFLEFDTNNGTVKLCHGTHATNPAKTYDVDETVITSDLLKKSSITDKPFKVSLSPYGEDYVLVDVNVDGQSVAGLFKKSSINTQTYAPGTNFYVAIGGTDNVAVSNNWKLNFYGYKALTDTYVAPTPQNPPATLADGLTDVATAEKNASAFSSGWASNTTISGGGVKLSYTKFSSDLNYSYATNIGASTGIFPGKKGFMLQFDGYVNKNTDASKVGNGLIGITLVNAAANSEIKEGRPFVLIDTNNGTLSLAHGTKTAPGHYEIDETVITNDILKYANITEKPFKVEFLPCDDTSITVAVDVDGTRVEGKMTKELFFAQTYAPSQTSGSYFLGISSTDTGADTNSWALNFYGFKNYGLIEEDTTIKAADAAEVTTAVNALSDTATLEAATDILIAKAKYDALSDTAKQSVTNAEKLTRLVNELNTLRQGAKYKATSTYIAITPEPYSEIGYHPFGNPGARSVFSEETENGFKVRWKGSGYSVGNYAVLTSQSVYGALRLDGMRLFIDNYTFEDANQSDFYIHFTSGDYTDLWDGTVATGQRMIVIHLGLAEQKLEINGVGLDGSWIAGNSSLITRDNLKDKKLIVEWAKQTNGDYICTLTIGEQVVAFTVAADKIAAMTDFDENRVRVVIGASNAKNAFNMEVSGIYAELDDTVKSVTKQISELPETVTSDADANTVEAVQKAYDALSIAQKEQILNAELLTAARAAVREYEGVNEKGRDNEGFYIPNLLDDVYGTSKDEARFAYVTESAYGGLHYDFNNGCFGLVSGFKDHYVVDNLTIRFDNFRYSNDSGLLIGFENLSGDVDSYNLTARSSREAFFLLIGKNNTVYSTLGGATYEEMFPIYEPNELLSAQNLLNKEFFISLKYDTVAKVISIIFTVDGTSFTYTYTTAQMERMDLFDPEDIEILVQSGCGLNPGVYPVERGTYMPGISIDITGVNYSEFSQAQYNEINKVISAIDALSSTASLETRDDILSVWDMYFRLTVKEMRLGVTNHSKLVNLYNELFDKDLLYVKQEAESEEQEDTDDNSSDDIIEDDYSYDTEYDDGYLDTDDELEKDSEPETETIRVKKAKKVKKAKDNESNNSWLLIAIIAGIVVGLAAITVMIIFAVKRRKTKEGKVNE